VRPCVLHFLTVPDLSPVEAIHIAAEVGYPFVSLRLQTPNPADVASPLLLDDVLAREVAEASRSTGVGIAEVDILRLPADAKADGLVRFIDRAASLGAKDIVAVGLDNDENKLTEIFASACALAAPLGMRVNLEPISWNAVRSLTQAQQIVHTAAQPNGGVLVDALHFHRMGESVDDLKKISPERLNIFHLCDAPLLSPVGVDALRVEARTARQMPGEGQLKLAPLLQALPSHTLMSVEVPNQKLLKEFTPKQRAMTALKATQSLFKGCL
jgi:sugar phosphate isomerase/epimerase